jgi:GNAT superfamily N-acetyltransferase
MPRLTDRDAIRSILETDRSWSLYALGDLQPPLWEQCEWYAAAGAEPALALLYRGAGTPVLLTVGAPEAVRPLLTEIADEPTLLLHVRPEIVALLRARYEVRDERPMWRMILSTDDQRSGFQLPAPGSRLQAPSSKSTEPGAWSLEPGAEEVVRLGPEDLGTVQALFADGDAAGETPDFFFPSMLSGGLFFGIREGDALVAAAGTHLIVPSEGVAAVGNVYTRRDRRGRGLAAQVTSAVTRELQRMGLRTIGLNVSQTNAPAIRVYERLGYERYCGFCEGIATRGPVMEDSPGGPG